MSETLEEMITEYKSTGHCPLCNGTGEYTWCPCGWCIDMEFYEQTDPCPVCNPNNDKEEREQHGEEEN